MKIPKPANEVLQAGHKLLRIVSKSVPLEIINTPPLNQLLSRMKKVLLKEKDGVALAAPQIGINLRLFVVNQTTEAGIYINPIIIKCSSKKQNFHEGCLSVRNIYGNIRRSEKVTVLALDETGRKFTRGASGLLAEIFQHEIDHLDGILFVDNAKNLQEIKANEQNP